MITNLKSVSAQKLDEESKNFLWYFFFYLFYFIFFNAAQQRVAWVIYEMHVLSILFRLFQCM